MSCHFVNKGSNLLRKCRISARFPSVLENEKMLWLPRAFAASSSTVNYNGNFSKPRTLVISSHPITTVAFTPRIKLNNYPTTMNRKQHRAYSALTEDEEKVEKERVANLTKYQKEMELRDLDKQIARLNTLRGINTGELYTLRGKFKALSRDYGLGFIIWYWTVWSSTAILTYSAIELGNVDAIALIAKVDGWTGYDLSSKVDKTLGTIGLTVAINELLEPIRLPFVVFTTKPVVEIFYPKRY